MKLVRIAPASGRRAVRERQARERTAAAPLRTLYPKLISLQVEFEFSDNSEFVPSPQVTVFHPPARAYFSFACPYGDCDGEFDLAQAVTSMMDAREPRTHGRLQCTGMRHGGVQCTLSLDYSLAAQRS
jgi:hypothetical protein